MIAYLRTARGVLQAALSECLSRPIGTITIAAHFRPIARQDQPPRWCIEVIGRGTCCCYASFSSEARDCVAVVCIARGVLQAALRECLSRPIGTITIAAHFRPIEHQDQPPRWCIEVIGRATACANVLDDSKRKRRTAC